MTNTLSNIQEYLTYDDVLLLPNYSEITPSKTDVSSYLTTEIPLKIPLVAAPMDTVCEEDMARVLGKIGAYGIIHRNLSIENQAKQVETLLDSGIEVGAAIGIGADFEDRIAALIKVGVKELCIDSAHGHTKHVIEATKTIKQTHPNIQVISGNVATYEGAKALFEAGADAVKVGMGPGSICTTRVISGMGVPQLTAVVEGVRAAEEFKRPIIADGGIRTSGDIVKALAAGASSVMLGSLLAGTDEAPGKIVKKDGITYKPYRGMGSEAAMKHGSATRYGQNRDDKQLITEGVEGLVPSRGPVEEHVYQLIGGLRAGMAYLGAATIKELQMKATFIKITQASLTESHPHSLIITNPGKNYS